MYWMKLFRWSIRKNQWLRKHRGISFEEVVEAISKRLLDVRESKSLKHPRQNIFIVDIEQYPWVVPFREVKEEIFLITAFPDRRLKEEFGYEN